MTRTEHTVTIERPIGEIWDCGHLKDILEANGTGRNDSRTDGP